MGSSCVVPYIETKAMHGSFYELFANVNLLARTEMNVIFCGNGSFCFFLGTFVCKIGFSGVAPRHYLVCNLLQAPFFFKIMSFNEEYCKEGG